MDEWLAKLKAVQADQVQQMMADSELQGIKVERDAAKQAALQNGIVVGLEPEPEPELVDLGQAAPPIAIRMEGQHLAELVNWDASSSLQGWLYKQSGGAVGGDAKKSIGGMRHKEDKRWFVLQRHFIFYFEKEQDIDARNHPKGALPVAGAQVADNLSMMDMSLRCTFHVVAQYADGQRKMTLRAETEAETSSWLGALRPHVEKVSAAVLDAVDRSPTPSGDENRVYCEGWLAKRSGGKQDNHKTVGELKKSWETRWFVLHHDRITYYKSQKAFLHREKAKATIPIQDMEFERGEKKLFKLKAIALGRGKYTPAVSAANCFLRMFLRDCSWLQCWRWRLRARMTSISGRRRSWDGWRTLMEWKPSTSRRSMPSPESPTLGLESQVYRRAQRRRVSAL